LLENQRSCSGLHIDALLRNHDSMQKDSFVNEIWTDMYLTDRRPILMNHNGLLAMTSIDPTLSQIQQSALILTSIVKFYCTLRDQQLPPHGLNSSNGFIPYDMSQFKNLGKFFK